MGTHLRCTQSHSHVLPCTCNSPSAQCCTFIHLHVHTHTGPPMAAFSSHTAALTTVTAILCSPCCSHDDVPDNPKTVKTGWEWTRRRSEARTSQMRATVTSTDLSNPRRSPRRGAQAHCPPSHSFHYYSYQPTSPSHWAARFTILATWSSTSLLLEAANSEKAGWPRHSPIPQQPAGPAELQQEYKQG